MGETGKSNTRLRAQRPRSALVLVDDEGLCDAVVAFLRDEGWIVQHVESFHEARAVIETDPPGVFLVDPGLHVDSLDRLVGRMDDRNSVPGVVVLSDLPTAADVASDHQVVFVREPFDLEELARACEAARRGDSQPRSSRMSG